MPATKLSDLFIQTLPLPEIGRIDYRDTRVPGLVLRASSSGVKSFSFTYDFKGKRHRLPIGQYPGVPLKLAHERATEARLAIQRGDNPVQEKKEEEREARLNGFSSCVTEFIKKHAKPNTKPKTSAQMERFFERFATPKFGDRPVKEIRRRDIIELIEEIAKDTPFQANQMRLYLSKMFNWLMLRDVVDANPVTGIPPPVDLSPRERILSDEELAAMWKAAGKLGTVSGAVVRLLALTGVRREEGACLRWDELELDLEVSPPRLKADWASMPGSRMKNVRDFKAPLSRRAKALIESMPRLGAFVFTTNGKTPFSGWGKTKERLDELMAEELELPEGENVKEWHLHDLRRTMAQPDQVVRAGFSGRIHMPVP